MAEYSENANGVDGAPVLYHALAKSIIRSALKQQ